MPISQRIRSCATMIKPLSGFSLIELMVVVSLFGIASSLITASYLNFERNQRVKNASNKLKSDFRFIQSKANAGDKGPGGVECDAVSTTLGGWYLVVEAGKSSYTFGGDCISGSNEVLFGAQSFDLPVDTEIKAISYGSISSVSYPVAVFYRPLGKGVSFHNASLALGAVPDFFDSSGVLANTIIPAPGGPVTIEISNKDGTSTKSISIQLSGEISSDD